MSQKYLTKYLFSQSWSDQSIIVVCVCVCVCVCVVMFIGTKNQTHNLWVIIMTH